MKNLEKITLGAGEFTAEIWNLGACVNDVRMPDRAGRVASVVLGYAREEDRRAGESYFGEICGPFANRIAPGGFEIDGQGYTPDLNDHGTSTLHGGSAGWSRQMWEVVHADRETVLLRLDWSDPHGGFPGPMHAEVEYRLHDWSLTHVVAARADVPAVVSVVSHPYFNLAGVGQPITDHELWVPASRFLPVDVGGIPLQDAPWQVDGTPFDFRVARPISEVVSSADQQILIKAGLDHALIVDGEGMRPAATLSHAGSGRALSIHSDYPALQVYTGQYMTGIPLDHPAGAGGSMTGIALETEEYPNAPRRPDFPSCLVRPGQTYKRTTTWQFHLTSQTR